MLVPPINVREFLQLLHKCKPPGSWAGPLAVANSGGPDSMCLLYLLSQAVRKHGNDGGVPTKIYSIHIDHGLQAANEDMKRKVSALAQSLEVKDIQCSIPWSTPPFPQRPHPGVAFEEIARNARSELLFQELNRWDLKHIAYGHHADDQVETVLMRMARGSGQLGAAGMRRARLWGMGTQDNSGLGFVGLAGMKKWILRPFLEIPKDRILATCEANKIDYVTDPSNYQPDATFRNYLRAQLASRAESLKNKPESHTGLDSSITPVAFSPNGGSSFSGNSSARTYLPVDHAIQKLQSLGGTDDLYEAVRRTNDAQCRVDFAVDSYLRVTWGFNQPIVSTFTFNPSLRHIADPVLRVALVRRILQFVSPHPWGSTAAEAHGSRTSLERIARQLWDTTTPPTQRKPFSAGAKVLWTPAFLVTDRIPIVSVNTKHASSKVSKIRRQIDNLQPGTAVWIAHRAPPSGHENHNIITHITGERLARGDGVISVLWDNRFVISLTMDSLVRSAPIHITLDSSIVIELGKRWLLPRITLRSGGRNVSLGHWREDSRDQRIKFVQAFSGVECFPARTLFPGAI
ncbi:PP-loop family-domain-containing protein [Irpex rosettiformis]|uniref:PP-loop family-domain-containing protein n=1 Tax=Irpex rosettiformis TaxID=378272 RepID=A0ACB8TWA5_9APHY|nr:PP-loop family-domain-containing protein [Irpex rosettiformis]